MLFILVPVLTVVMVTVGLFLYYGTDIFRRLPSPLTDVTATSALGEWAMSRHDPAHTGYSVQEVAPPQGVLKWQFTTSQPLFSSPAVVDDILYLATGDKRLIAFYAESGHVKWEIATSGPVNSSPAIADGVLYIGLRDSRLIAVDTSTGNLKWQVKLGAPIVSSPTVYGGIVYVTGLKDKLYAIDAASGEIHWIANTQNPMSTSSPAISQGLVVVGSRMRGEWHLTGVWGGSVYCVNAMSGRILLEYHTQQGILASPAVWDDVAYVGDLYGNLYAIDITERSWPLEWPILKIWANIYFWGMAPPPPPQSGFIWSFKADGAINTAPAIAQGILYFGTDAGTCYAIDTTGEEQWRFVTDQAVTASPIIGNGVVYFGSANGRCYALDAASGEKLWEFVTGDRITAEPTLAQGMLYIASEDGNLYALE
jgi:outer membrane protein assembly factor BamB